MSSVEGALSAAIDEAIVESAKALVNVPSVIKTLPTNVTVEAREVIGGDAIISVDVSGSDFCTGLYPSCVGSGPGGGRSFKDTWVPTVCVGEAGVD